ncbi:subtilisin-like protease SBT4.3 [Phoenix dactylifera]|uniref:Subtilisin-like protease SBT4.3 n=1 Tax=Phoenix dactylifera TaxID=42345 RepID=A0A8B8ZFE5_PHODC|nr:subtilisin-like protease SBT4.3 [Phoenix dactylifera]
MQVYIVYMGDRHSEDYSTESLHLNMLDRVIEDSSAQERLVYSYKRSFNGFAAKLKHEEQKILAGMDGVVSVFPSRTLKPHTTRSWDFLGFTKTEKRNLALERDIIVGMLDTGIWPESESFRDEGLGPPPKRWKGACVNLRCNNKIIGARYYGSGDSVAAHLELSPRDFEGHGTHTASTVAGDLKGNASLYGLAPGTARGGVPSARIAVYKICWADACQDHDILAAFDDAIADGVDMISVSLGAGYPVHYFEDAIAIGSFHAMKKGILTSASAGNDGPSQVTVSNVAPWMLVAAASTTDRHIVDKLVLGNNRTVSGFSINTFPTEKRFYPFVFAMEKNTFEYGCSAEILKNSAARGKILLCGYYDDGGAPLLAGAKGMVMLFDSESSYTFPLPAIGVLTKDAKMLVNYINKTRNPVANIRKSEAVFDPKAPVVASFSSRGPSLITPDILKPDLSAPGVDILAAWSPNASISSYENDTRSVKYNIISGTSMSCPHVTAVAAYVKSFHPKWSPAAIMSALITTASPMNPSYHPDAELAHGAGQVNPIKARSPGLVYDASARDYVQMLCNQGYNDTTIRAITGDNNSCPKDSKGSPRDLNYPSIAVYVKTKTGFHAEFPRIVTNVGYPRSTYTARINSGSKLNVTVNPRVLSFRKLYQKQKFVVTVSGPPLSLNSTASASIIWSDGKHHVRSPIVAYGQLP